LLNLIVATSMMANAGAKFDDTKAREPSAEKIESRGHEERTSMLPSTAPLWCIHDGHGVSPSS